MSGGSDFGNLPTLGSQFFQVARLVLLAAPRQAVQHGIVAHRALEVFQRHRALQVGQVAALQKPHQVGRRVEEALVDQLHRGFTGPSPMASGIMRPQACDRRERAASMLRETRPTGPPASTA